MKRENTTRHGPRVITYPCAGCGNRTLHLHKHDKVAEPQKDRKIYWVHKPGTEYFECSTCGHLVGPNDPEAKQFPFELDKPR